MARNDGLRDYQQEMKLRLFEEWELHRSVMVQMPTGTGKTHLLAAVVKEFLCGGGDRKSTRLNSSHGEQSRMPSSA